MALTNLLNTEQAVNEFMDIFMTELKNQLASMGKAVTGELIGSLSYKVNRSGNGFQAVLTSASYLDVVDGGRRPGKFPPLNDIRNWVEAKGIKIGTLDQTAFVIARSISQKGIKPTNVIEISFDIAWDRYQGKFADKIEQDFNEMIDSIQLKLNNAK